MAFISFYRAVLKHLRRLSHPKPTLRTFTLSTEQSPARGGSLHQRVRRERSKKGLPGRPALPTEAKALKRQVSSPDL